MHLDQVRDVRAMQTSYGFVFLCLVLIVWLVLNFIAGLSTFFFILVVSKKDWTDAGRRQTVCHSCICNDVIVVSL